MEYEVKQVRRSLACTSSCTYTYRIFGNDESGLVRAALQHIHGAASFVSRLRVYVELHSALRIREFCYQNAVLLGGTTVADDGTRAQLMRLVDEEVLAELMPESADDDALYGMRLSVTRRTIMPKVHEAAERVYDDLLSDSPLITLYGTLHRLSESANIARSSNEVSKCVEVYAKQVVSAYLDHMFVLDGVDRELKPISSAVVGAEKRASAAIETERVDRLIATVEASRPSRSK